MRLAVYYFLIFVYFCISNYKVYSISLGEYPTGWVGDTALFVINENEHLQLKAPEEAGSAFLFYPSEVMDDAVWNIHVILDFNPSSANFLKIYLATDGVGEFENGFYLVVGTTKDNISLWERTGGKDYLLIDGTEKLLDLNSVDLELRVSRRADGYWKLEANNGRGWVIEGETYSRFGFRSKWFGFSCHYTKSRADKFFVQEISVQGNVFNWKLPFQITMLEVVNGHTFSLQFSKEISAVFSDAVFKGKDFDFPPVENIVYDEDSTSVIVKLKSILPDIEEGHLVVSGWCSSEGQCMQDTVISISYSSPKVVQFFAESFYELFLSFNISLPDGLLQPQHFKIGDGRIQIADIIDLGQGEYRLRLNQPLEDASEILCYIEDLILPNGDNIRQGPYPLYYHEAGPFDIVFSEIMHDPFPAALLPEYEYIELFNRSDLPVNLKNMTLSVNGNKIILGDYLLYPGDYVAISQNGADTFPRMLVPEKWVTLTNSGGELVLFNPSGIVVAAFRYPPVLEGYGFKEKGGWSMEVIDADNLSNDLRNWAYSTDERGGTPGEPNSVAVANPDITYPKIMDAWLENDSVLAVVFSEPLNLDDAIVSDFFLLSNDDLDIKNTSWDTVFKDKVWVEFKERLIPHKVEEINIPSNISDLAGNLLHGETTLLFGLPGRIDSFDIVINELLFDPPVAGYEYVEFYNRSQKIASLDSLCISRNDNYDQPEELIPLSDRIRWFLPGQHLCFTKNAGWVKSNFVCEAEDQLIELSDFPNFISDGGVVFLTRLNGEVIDRFDYSPDFHFKLLKNTKGVALERIAYDVSTNSPMSWHSASSMVGYGTPTGRNSQLVEVSSTEKSPLFEVSPKIFTPDLDGIDDFLIISYRLGSPGHKGTFIIYDVEGRPVKYLVNNKTLSTSGTIIWDGIADDYTLAPPGIYIIWCRVFDLNGRVREYKDSFVLGIRGSN